jgi:hypothetical protein
MIEILLSEKQDSPRLTPSLRGATESVTNRKRITATKQSQTTIPLFCFSRSRTLDQMIEILLSEKQDSPRLGTSLRGATESVTNRKRITATKQSLPIDPRRCSASPEAELINQ